MDYLDAKRRENEEKMRNDVGVGLSGPQLPGSFGL